MTNDRVGPLHKSRRGWTLIELMIVLGTIGLAMQLMLPALGYARESARRLVCVRHLQQIGLAANLHHDALNAFPSGGWHFDWIGEPERGTGPDQPGSWVFNLLHYLDAEETRSLGRNLTGDERWEAIRQRCLTVQPMLHCPSRREAVAYPYHWNRRPRSQDGQAAQDMELAAKTDYAANTGDSGATEYSWRWQGPRTLAEGDDASFTWPNSASFNGIIFGRSWVRRNQILDGTGHTYLIGEKYMDPRHYSTGKDWGDNESLYSGFNNDNCRSTGTQPQRDRLDVDLRNSFGSAHQHGWHVLLADGSVRMQNYLLHPAIHREFGNRADDQKLTAVNDLR